MFFKTHTHATFTIEIRGMTDNLEQYLNLLGGHVFIPGKNDIKRKVKVEQPAVGKQKAKVVEIIPEEIPKGAFVDTWARPPEKLADLFEVLTREGFADLR